MKSGVLKSPEQNQRAILPVVPLAQAAGSIKYLILIYYGVQLWLLLRLDRVGMSVDSIDLEIALRVVL